MQPTPCPNNQYSTNGNRSKQRQQSTTPSSSSFPPFSPFSPVLAALRVLFILALVLAASPAEAHKPSDSYLKLRGGGESLAIQWDLAIKDLDFLLGIDANQDGDITWGELKDRRSAIESHALSRLSIAHHGKKCELAVSEMKVVQHSDGNYAVLMIDTNCPGDAELLDIEYRLLFDIDPTHRGLVLYDNGQVTSTHVLSPSNPTLELHTNEATLWRTFVQYVIEGVWHIWIGFDHILFLISLLLPAVLVLVDKRWQPVERFGPACRSVLKIVTVFTLAHSITLWLAVMEYVTLPSQMVEATIAFSIVVTALHNLFPVIRLPGWIIAFVFGLIHGFGFANVLLDLGLSSTSLAVSLLAFNVGVELGQIAIVLVFFPIAYAIRGTEFYKWVVLRGGSAVIAVIAVLWMIERIGNMSILPF